MSSVMLKLQPGSKPIYAAAKKEVVITDKFSLMSTDDNTLTLDFARFSKDGKTFSPPYFVQYINELLIKENYIGKLWLKYEFMVKDIPGRALLRFERNKGISVNLNGAKLKVRRSAWDVLFSECDVAGTLKTGVNEFTMRLDYFQQPHVKPTESLKEYGYQAY